MPRLRDLVDNRVLPALVSSFFTRRVTIQRFVDGARQPSGYVPREPETVTGHDGIPAAIEPLDTRGDEQRRTEPLTTAFGSHQIILAGYYPDITPNMRAVADDGQIYGIEKVDVDTFHTLTRLDVRQITPVAREGA